MPIQHTPAGIRSNGAPAQGCLFLAVLFKVLLYPLSKKDCSLALPQPVCTEDFDVVSDNGRFRDFLFRSVV